MPLPALIDQPLTVGDTVWAGVDKVYDRMVDGKPVHPDELLVALRPTIVATYEHVVKHPPDSATTLTVAGHTWLDKGHYDQAIAAYTQAVQADASYGLAYGYRGVAYQMLGAKEQATADFNKALLLLENEGHRRWIERQWTTLQAV